MNKLKSFLHYILVLALTTPVSAAPLNSQAGPKRSQPMAFYRLVENYGRTQKPFRAKRIASRVALTDSAKPNLFQSTSAGTVNLAGHYGQTMVLMLIISGVELVRREIEMSHLKGRAVDYQELMNLSGKVAEEILVGGSTWMSLLGGSLAGEAAKKPLLILNTLLRDAKTRPILHNLIQSGITSFITFVGWEAGGQLWDEARELIEDDADYERANLLGPRVFGAIGSILSGGSKGDDVRILKTIFGNMVQILFRDHELRSLWLYNAWRMRIATGHFTTLVTSMVGAGVIGTSLFPGAGTLAGLCFGLAGGTLALFIPEHIKESITDEIVDGRVAMGEGRLATARVELKTFIRGMNAPSMVADEELLKKSNIQRAGKILMQAKSYREDVVTAHFEALFRIYSQLKILQGNRKVATAAGNSLAVSEINQKIGASTNAFHRNLKEAANFYNRQIQEFDRLRMKSALPEVATMLSRERETLVMLSAHLSLITTGLAESCDDTDGAYQDQLALTKIYLLGFKEAYLQDSWQSARSDQD